MSPILPAVPAPGASPSPGAGRYLRLNWWLLRYLPRVAVATATLGSDRNRRLVGRLRQRAHPSGTAAARIPLKTRAAAV